MPSGTPGVADFTIFTVRASAEDVLQGVFETLRDDQEIAPFLGASEILDSGGHSFSPKQWDIDGRIVTIAQPDFLPDLPTPYCAVSLLNETGTFQPNAESELIVPIAIRLVWDVLDETTASSEKGAATFFNRCRFALLSDQRLENPSNAQPGRGIVDLTMGFQTIVYGAMQTAGSDFVTLLREMIVSYRVTVNAKTGQPVYT